VSWHADLEFTAFCSGGAGFCTGGGREAGRWSFGFGGGWGAEVYKPVATGAGTGGGDGGTRYGVLFQVNVETHKRRAIRLDGRIPRLLVAPRSSAAAAEAVGVDGPDGYKAVWLRPVPRVGTFRRVPVPVDSAEFAFAAALFNRTARSEIVFAVERVETPHLYAVYAASRAVMAQMGFSERWMFHGTSASSVDSIGRTGFSRSYAGVNGVVYGQGVYFATDAAYSVQFATGCIGHRHMFLSRVLPGRTAPGHKNMRQPPDDHHSTGNGSNIFVVYHDANAYPDYIIRF